MMNVRYKKETNAAYMILEGTADCEEYAARMLAENRIRGVMPLSVREINGGKEYYFDISCGRSMSGVLEKRPVTMAEIRSLLQALNETVLQMDEYLMNINHLILDPGMICLPVQSHRGIGGFERMEADFRHALFCCHPAVEKDFLAQVRELIQYFLNKMDHMESRSVETAYELFQISQKEYFRLGEMMEVCRAAGEGEESGDPGRDEQEAYLYDRASAAAGKDGSPESAGRGMSGNISEENDRSSVSGARNLPSVSGGKIPAETSGSRRSAGIVPVDKKNAGNTAVKRDQGNRGTAGRRKAASLLAVFLMLAGVAFGIWNMLSTFLLDGWDGIGGNSMTLSVICLAAGALLLLFCAFRNASAGGAPGSGQDRSGAAGERSGETIQPARMEFPAKQPAGTVPEYEFPAKQKNGGVNSEYDAREESRVLPAAVPEILPTGEGTSARNSAGGTEILTGRFSHAASPVLVSENLLDQESIYIRKIPFTLGKSRDEVDGLLEWPTVSRCHAKIDFHGGEYTLTDCRSTNGTTVNGQPLDPEQSVPLHVGDEVALADRRFIFQFA